MKNSRHKLAVLLVDDEQDLLESLQLLLSSHVDATITNNSNTAYEMINKNPEAYDVVISDLIMQEMSGMDLYNKIKTSHPGLEDRMIFMTGGIFTKSTNDFLNSIKNPSIEKPFKVSTLLELINKIAHTSTTTEDN